MAKNTFLDFSTTAGDNTDLAGIGILGSNSVSNFDDAFRTLMAVLRRDLDNGTVFATKAATYTAVADDSNKFIEFTATATLNLTAAATLAADWHITVFANGGAVTVDPNGTELINGGPTLTISNGDAAYIVCNGTAFKAITFRSASKSTKGHIYGLTLSNNATDVTNDIDIAAGEAADDGATPYLMALTSSLTKRLDAAWAVGSGNGGLDTGAIANTTYHVWLIQRSDTGVVDALFSASATSPTMPANYDRKRRIGSIRRVSGAIVTFVQTGDYFKIAPVSDRSNTAAAASALLALSVPTGVSLRPLVTIVLSISAINTSVSINFGDGLGSSADTSVAQISTDASVSRAVDIAYRDDFFTNTSGQIYFSQTNASGTPANSELRTNGWIDTRGRS